MRRKITEQLINLLKPKSSRYLVYDSLVPEFAVRVSTSGHKSFCFVARFNGPHPTRRSLGPCGKTALDAARDKARDWQKLIHKGENPARPRGQSFDAICEDFYRHIKKQRRAADVEAMLRRELGRWNDRPLDFITKRDVIEAIDAVMRRGSPSTAHHLFAYMRRVFNFAIARDICEHSPCDRIKPSVLIGPKGTRQRILSDDELRTFWSACGKLGYPYGVLYRLRASCRGIRLGDAGSPRPARCHRYRCRAGP